jgi:hypothetical protein
MERGFALLWEAAPVLDSSSSKGFAIHLVLGGAPFAIRLPRVALFLLDPPVICVLGFARPGTWRLVPLAVVVPAAASVDGPCDLENRLKVEGFVIGLLGVFGDEPREQRRAVVRMEPAPKHAVAVFCGDTPSVDE